jgi:TolB protein
MTCGSGKIREIYSIDPTGKSVYRHTNDKNLALSPAWSRDNRSIAYTSYTKENKRKFVNPNLYIQDLSTGKRNLVSSQIGMNSGASFSQNDNLLAYTFSGTKIPEIYILNLAQKVRYKITNSFAFAVEPTWSPDGSKLAFSQRTYGNPHIWISDANGQQRRQLTKAGKYNSTPAWSPDGKTIAFAGQENDSTEFNIFTVNLRTGEIQRVTSDDYSNENPSYSPDGRFLAMASKINGKYRIRVVNLQTGRSAIISPLSLGECKQPAWSFGKTQYLN